MTLMKLVWLFLLFCMPTHLSQRFANSRLMLNNMKQIKFLTVIQSVKLSHIYLYHFHKIKILLFSYIAFIFYLHQICIE